MNILIIGVGDLWGSSSVKVKSSDQFAEKDGRQTDPMNILIIGVGDLWGSSTVKVKSSDQFDERSLGVD